MVARGPYNSTAPAGSIWNVTLDSSSLGSLCPDITRVKGSLGFRATFCFRLQIAATPQIGGRLRLCYHPFFDSARTDDQFRTNNAPMPAQLPGIDLDLSEKTAVEMRIPYVHPLDFLMCPGNAVPWCMGQVSVVPVLPCSKAATDTFPQWTIYSWLEDLEMIGAYPTDQVVAFPQSGLSASDSEAASLNGLLSGPLLHASKAVQYLSDKIPLLSSYAGPTAWALRVGGKVASAFGFSKPMVVEPLKRVMHSYNTQQTHCNGADNCLSLSVFSDNTVCALPGFAGSNIDEMSLAFVLKQYGVINYFTLASQPNDTLVYAACVCPNAWVYSSTLKHSPPVNVTSSTTPKAYYTTPIGYVGQCFRKWRGGVKYRLICNKTKFHSGRLLVGFIPAYGGNGYNSVTGYTVPTALSQQHYTCSIWDLREGNEFEFECPWESPLKYRENWDPAGVMFVRVIDPLTFPASVGSSIMFRVEVCGAPDFEYAVPCTPTWWPACTNAAQAVIVPQSGITEAEQCMGERVLSLKQLCLMAGTFNIGTPGASPGGWYLDPIGLRGITQFTQSGGSVTSITWPANKRTYTHYLSYMYAMWRGGTCYSILPTHPQMTTTATVGDVDNITGPVIMEAPGSALHIKIPYCSSTGRSRFSTVLHAEGAHRNAYLRGTSVGGLGSYVVQLRAADDFQMGYFVGSPVVWTPMTTTDPSYDYWNAGSGQRLS